jgi:hypothetical protein
LVLFLRAGKPPLVVMVRCCFIPVEIYKRTLSETPEGHFGQLFSNSKVNATGEYFVLDSIVLEQEIVRSHSVANGAIDQAFQLDHMLACAAPDAREAVHSNVCCRHVAPGYDSSRRLA